MPTQCHPPHTHTHCRSMFVGRQYKRVSQQGDSDSDTTDNETAFFTSENGTRKWRMGMSPGNLNQDQEFDFPYVHPTLPVELKKEKLTGHFSRRQFISGACLLLVILAMVAAFSVTIILGQKFIVEAPPTDNHNNIIVLVTTLTNNVPAMTPLVNFDLTKDNEKFKGSAPVHQDSTRCTSTAAGAMVTSSPTVKNTSSLLSPTRTSTVKLSSRVPSTTPQPTAATQRTYNVISSNTEERKWHPFPPWPARGHHNIHAEDSISGQA